MELRCRVCNINTTSHKLGNKARNVNKPGALHTPSLRLDFLALLFVSRQKVEEEKKYTPEPIQKLGLLTSIKSEVIVSS